MKYLSNILLLTFLSASLGFSQNITKKWEVSGLEAPESAILYQDFIYVSNVAGQPTEKNGNGYISKVGLDGQLVELKWAAGFNAPKGLGIFNDQLFVADIDKVVVVDMENGNIVNTFNAEGATFLNDVEVAKGGTIYISDTFGGNAIYQITNNTISILIKDERLNYPNGLKLKGDDLYVASWGVVTNPETFETEVPGKVLKVDLKTNSVEEIIEPIGNLDGLVNFKGGFLVSDWIAGSLLVIDRKGTATELMDLNSGSADINYISSKNVLLIPQMIDGKLVAYELK